MTNPQVHLPTQRRRGARVADLLRGSLRVSCALLLTASLHAQFGLPPEADLFGDDIVRRVDPENGGQLRDDAKGDKKEKPKVTGFDPRREGEEDVVRAWEDWHARQKS